MAQPTTAIAEEIIRMSAGLGVENVIECVAHAIDDATMNERERICKIAAGVLVTSEYEQFKKRVDTGATSFW